MQYRLDKFITLACRMTRQEAKQAIKKKLILVDGEVICKPEFKIDPEHQQISYQGKQLYYEPYVYYMLNKPDGVVSATKDNVHKTVLDILGDVPGKDLFPVGRLDIDTQGLLLITNDGDLGHRLTSPAHHVSKVYEVIVDKPLDENVVQKFACGFDIGESKNTLPATLTIPSQEDATHALVTIQEGKFHQVKRMFYKCGYQVTFLKRIQMGPLKLDGELEPGEFRRLSPAEITALHSANK